MVRLMIGQIGVLVQRNWHRVSRKCLDRHSAAPSGPNQRKVEVLKPIQLPPELGKSLTGRQRLLVRYPDLEADKQPRFSSRIMFP
jgi:hypothetical protein